MDLVITTGLKKSESATYNTLTKIFNKSINADIIIMGSSKANVQVSPKILDTILSMNTYNLGLNGMSFGPQHLENDLYLKHNPKPKIIIQIVSNGLLVKKKELFGFMRYAPYLNLQEVKEMNQEYKGFTFLDYYIPFIRYSGHFGVISNGLLCNFGLDKQKDINYKGYQEMDVPWDDTYEKYIKDNPNGTTIPLDNKTKTKFITYLANAKRNNILVFMVYAPTYEPSQKLIKNRPEIFEFYTKTAFENGAIFIDYSNKDISTHKNLFYN